jgi:hypothetical protein
VDKALRSARSAIKQALKGLNQAAAQRMSKGDYPAAEALATKGREIQQFRAEVDALFKRWRELRQLGGQSGPKKTATALWAYYQPILRALVEADGEARRVELEPTVERLMDGMLQPGDREPLGRGTVRWQVMIRRARKHLSAEGWIEGKPGGAWRITDAGRRAAAKPISPPDKG